MVRVPCCERMGMKKGPWTSEEDHILISYIQTYGHDNWRALPKQAGLLRCGKSCRLRWTNYLRPDIKRGNFTKEEEEIIIKLHQNIGNRWSAIATKLPGRTDNEIKNYWHTRLKKKVEEEPLKRLRFFSSLQTSILGINNLPETWILSNSPGNNLPSNGNYYSLAKQISKEDELILQKKLSDDAAKENYINDEKLDGRDFCLTNKSLESRAQILPTGDEDHANSDMDFWYNIFVNAGKSHEKIE